jgi:hypothetical protein
MTALHDDDDANKPVRPTWAVGALFRGTKRIHINCVSFHIVFTCMTALHDDDNKPVWPTWIMGARFRSARTYSRRSCMFSHTPVIEELGHPRQMQKAP